MGSFIRFVRALVSFVKITRDTTRLDEVFNLSSQLATPKNLKLMADEFAKHSKCAEAMVTRPRLGRVDLEELRRLPEGTLGREFAEHMFRYDLKLESIPVLEAKDELKYVMAHLYETHDIWHVVAGFKTDVAGELGVQAFYLSQTPAKLPPVILAAGLLNGVLFAPKDIEARLEAIVKGWTMGKKAKPLFGVRWERIWDLPLAQVRRDLGLAPEAAHAARPQLAPAT